ncbi:MAG: PAS domain S-box protein [Promethearchaeota archaeon]
MKTRDLKYYFPAYPLLPIGYFFYYLHIFDPNYRLIGNLFFFVACILTIIGSFLEYNHVFQMNRKKVNIYPLFFLSFSTIFLMGLQFILIILLVVSGFFQAKIFLKLKTPRHVLIMLFQGSSGFAILNSILDSFNIKGAWELSYISTVMLATFLMIIPVVTYIEKLLIKSREKLKKSEQEFQVLFNNSTSGIAYHEIIYDKKKNPIDYIITDVNLQYEKILSLKRKDVINRKSTDVYQVEDPPYIDIYSRVAHTQKSVSFESYFPPLDKHFKISVISPKNGVFITVFDDITERINAEKISKTEKDRLQAFMDGLTSSGIGVDIVNINYEVIIQNKILKERFGDLNEELCFKKYLGRKTPCDYCPMREAIKNNKVESIELTGKDGRNYELISAPIPKSDGIANQAIEIILDITERKIAEKKLKESEEKFRTITEESHLAICILQDNVVKYANQKIADLYEYTIEEILNWKRGEFTKIFAEDSLDIVLEQAKKKQAGDSDIFVQYQIHCIKKSGKLFWVDNISKTITFQERPADLITLIDITKKKKAEQKLKESEEKYRMLFEGANDAIFLLKDYKLSECNTKSLEVFGINTELDIIGIFPWDISPLSQPDGRDSKQTAIDYMNEALTGKPQRFYWQHLKKNGNLFDTEVSLNRILLDNEYHLQAIVRDITERKEAERLIIEENKKLQELNEIRQDLITRISHELKTPISSTYGATQALLELYRKDMSEEILEFVEIIQQGGKRLKSLIENLLESIKVEERVLKLNFSKENLIKIIEECVKDMQYHANNRNVEINTYLPDELILNVDKIRIGQVIINIISNAINNTPAGGNIFISIDKKNEYVDLIIKDTGVGITEQEKSRLFKKFGKIERFGKGDDVYIEGSGLGLYISKEYVKLHGGEILVESGGRNQGATFIVRLFR